MKAIIWMSAALLMVSAAAPAAVAADSLSKAQKDEIGAVVRDYLIEHPEILAEAQQALETKRKTTLIDDNRQAIFNAPEDVSLGNPKGKIEIAEFFDYNCGYCRHAMPAMDAIIKSNPNVRFVLKEFPILGPDSLTAYKVSDAFRRLAPEKYGEFHRELLGGDHADEARAIEVAQSLGVSEKAIRAEMAKSSNEDSARATYKIAKAMDITGTPSYVIGDQLIIGAVDPEVINDMIVNMGQCGKTAC